MNCVVNNQEHFQTTRNRDHFHRPTANLSYFQKVHTMLASKSSTVYHQI